MPAVLENSRTRGTLIPEAHTGLLSCENAIGSQAMLPHKGRVAECEWCAIRSRRRAWLTANVSGAAEQHYEKDGAHDPPCKRATPAHGRWHDLSQTRPLREFYSPWFAGAGSSRESDP